MNNTELFINDFYQSINITDPDYLTIEMIADKTNMQVIYWGHSSILAFQNDIYKIFINETVSRQKRWQEFGHEMSHYFKDRGNQNILYESYINYCESKADYFAYHFCVPTFMLRNLKEVSVSVIVNTFNVEYEFALRRLDMYKNNLMNRRKNNALQEGQN